jgi:hypothetical protein
VTILTPSDRREAPVDRRGEAHRSYTYWERALSICLEPEQLALFEELLETWREAPRDQREPFLYVRVMGGNVIQGNGIDKANVTDGDVDD